MKNLEKYKKLVELSQTAKAIQDIHGGTINEIIVEKFYKDLENTEFNTLKQWNEKGKRIKKGEKAFLVWGKPKQNNKENEEETDEDGNKFYPVAYIFSNKQVS